LSSLKRVVLQPKYAQLSRTLLRAQSTAGTSFSERERGEENKYFRKQEELKKAELKARLEKLLEEDDSSAQKISVIEQLTKKPEEKSILSKYHLDKWSMQLPLALWVIVPLITNEIMQLTLETHLLTIFLFVASSTYISTADSVAKTLSERKRELAEKMRKVDDSVMSDVYGAQEMAKSLLTIDSDVAKIHALVDDLSIAQADVLTLTKEAEFREEIIKKLVSLTAVEESISAQVHTRMVSSVKADVISTFKTDKKVKEQALAQALSVLAGGASTKLGADVVGNVYKNSLKAYRDSYAKNADKDELYLQLQKDLAAITAAPAIPSQPSNVHETHPVF